jgi:hypothetical protein
MTLTIEEARNISDKSWDDANIAQDILNRSDETEFIKIRTKPCDDCAVMWGMYSDIAATCYKHLTQDKCLTVAKQWSCHNGG